MTDIPEGRRDEAGHRGDAGRSMDTAFDKAALNGATRAWHAYLDKTDKGGWHATVSNAAIIFEHDDVLRGLVRFNELTNDIELMRAPPPMPGLVERTLPGPYPRSIDVGDEAALIAHFEREWARGFNEKQIRYGLRHAAMLDRYHPIRDWLRTLRWDGVRRIDAWLHIAFGTPDDAYHAAVGSKLLIASARRVLHPGTKFDTMLVVEGDQGIGKSTVFRRLYGDPWFTDDMHPKLDSPEAGRSIQGKWCIEMAEIEQILRHETETVKGFLSKQADRIRALYANSTRDLPRQCVFVGTTNEQVWLRDATGNRRFWPVRATQARAAWVGEFRDQLWAEAMVREALGEGDPAGSVHLDNALIQSVAEQQQQARELVDPWQTPVLMWCDGRDRVTTEEVLTQAIGLLPKDQQQRHSTQVARILRKAGWERRRARPGSDVPDNRPRWFFFAPSPADSAAE